MSRLLPFALVSLLAAGAQAAPDHVVPYAGVIDKNGAPFSGVAVLNFGLFRCPTGNCEANNTLVWQASGNGAFPANDAVGINVTANGGKFSVLLGDTGQAALVPDVWRTSQLHVRIAVKAGTTWVPLSGFQRVAPVATAITAEEAASFTVRQDLTVAGNAAVTGAVTANRATLTGALNASSVVSTGTLSAGGATTLQGTSVSTLNVSGTTVMRGQVALNDVQLRFRDASDANHGVRFTNTFGTAGGIDGPVLWGNSGGGLGTGVSGAGVTNTERLVLRWNNNGDVTVQNTLNAGSYQKNSDPLFIFCERRVTESRGGNTQSFSWDAGQCGGRLPSNDHVGVFSELGVCSGANTFSATPSGVTWFVAGSGCSNQPYNVRVVYIRK